jgi:hypothetical protein
VLASRAIDALSQILARTGISGRRAQRRGCHVFAFVAVRWQDLESPVRTKMEGAANLVAYHDRMAEFTRRRRL